MIGKDSLILAKLIERKNEKQNILNLSKELKMDYKNTYNIIRRLEEKNLVKLERFGQTLRIKPLFQAHPLFFEAEYNRRKELLKNKDLAVTLKEIKKNLRTKLYALLLFGSYAKKKQTKKSDIDLLFIVPEGKEEEVEKQIHETTKIIPLPIHSVVLSEKQYTEMLGDKEPNVAKEAQKNNIILYGIETYYELK